MRREPPPYRAALALLVLAACAPDSGSMSPPATADQLPERQVRTAVAGLEVWPRVLRVTGELEAFEDVTVSTKVSGRVESVAVDLGSVVEAGQELARLETREYELQLAQSEAALQAARARLGLAVEGDTDEVDSERTAIVREARALLDEARQERDRLVPLIEQGIVNQSEFDSAEAAFRVAESRLHGSLEEVETRRANLAQRRAELQAARQALDDTLVRAPFAGAVGERIAGTGDYLSVGAPVARLVRFDPVRVRLAVPEREAAGVHVGQAVSVTIEGAGPPRAASVLRTAPQISERSRTLQIELELPNPEGVLRPGSFARGEIVVDPQARTLVVPRSALVRFAGIDKVVAVQDGRAVERPVEVGRVEGERAEVLAGLEPGTEVVLEPGNLQTGQAVTAAER